MEHIPSLPNNLALSQKVATMSVTVKKLIPANNALPNLIRKMHSLI